MDDHATQDCWKRQKEQNQQHQQSRKLARGDNNEVIFAPWLFGWKTKHGQMLIGFGPLRKEA
jgi:hypothetical protein